MEVGIKVLGVAIHKRLLHQIEISISFSAFSSRVCQLPIELGHNMLQMHWCIFSDQVGIQRMTWNMCILCSIYSWMHGSRTAASPILGGDFNACIGPLESREAMDQIGHWGSGMQN